MRYALGILLPLLGLALGAAGPLQAQSLRGSPSSVERMYQHARSEGLYFFETYTGVRRAAGRGDLVRLSGNGDYELGDVSSAYVLPSTRLFVQRLARQYRSGCGEKLVVTSATRPRSLRLINSVDRSVHPTGMAVDLRKPRDGRCLMWLRGTLLALENRGVLEATEEHHPPHFHVAVFPTAYPRYVRGDAPAPKKSASTAVAGPQRYRVRAGDSLWSIARRNRVSVAALRSANGLRSSRIQAGQLLTIPASK
ncbi:MAG TPA: DUF5715 family protein [Longimicrobiaceae bacterium]|nr:DUF5715 family protein [Longimicrobiaceae bacterium]